jgi:hypothetical protein
MNERLVARVEAHIIKTQVDLVCLVVAGSRLVCLILLSNPRIGQNKLRGNESLIGVEWT